MHITYPLTVYFDASCRLCNSEMQNIKQHDAQQRLILIDCSAHDFDTTICKQNNISLDTMMNRLHAQDAAGQWLMGVSAFEVIYRTIGMPLMANIWGHTLMRPLTERLYPWIADHRYLFSRLGFPELITLYGRYAARRADKRSRACHEGKCTAND
ncbi:MAG: DUF393 domain-containing protein [Methylococcales bacterium]